MDRRTFLGASTATALLGNASASAALPDAAAAGAMEQISLWPGTPPGGTGANIVFKVTGDAATPDPLDNRLATGIARPALYVFRAATPDGSSLLVLPGGGYRELQIDNEGFDVARRFAAAGITTFVLLYRLPDEGWQDARDVPLQDAQRALRLIRFNAARYGIDAERVGVLGFSAGGHLAASLATRSDAKVYAAVDAADALAAKPAFMALLYPVITMLPPYAHEASREMLLGEHPTLAERTAYSCERAVTAATPPGFLVAAADDPDVSIENTLQMFASLRAHSVPAEMHMFERGGHGFGIHGATGLPAADWPQLLLNWGASRGYFRQAPAAP